MKHIEPDIARRLAGQLEPEQERRFDAHVAECPDCARLVAETRSLWDALGDASAVRDAQQVSSVWGAVQERTTGREGEWFFGASHWVRSVLAVGTVAAGLVLSVLLPGGGPGPESAGAAELESIWLEESAWTTAAGEGGLETLWLDAGLESEADSEEER